MTQFVNETDETIVLEPGEGVSGTSTINQFEGTTYRITMDEVGTGPVDADALPTARDFMDREWERRTDEGGD